MNKLCNGQIKTNSEFLMKILQNYIWKCGYYGICYLVPYYLQLLTCNVSEEITKFEITYTFILQKKEFLLQIEFFLLGSSDLIYAKCLCFLVLLLVPPVCILLPFSLFLFLMKIYHWLFFCFQISKWNF